MGFLENIVRRENKVFKVFRVLRGLKDLKDSKDPKDLSSNILHELVAELHAGIIEEFSYISLLTLFTYKKYISGVGNEEVFDILHYYQFILGKNHYVVAAVV